MRSYLLALGLMAGLAGCSGPVAGDEGAYHIMQRTRTFTSVINGTWTMTLRVPRRTAPGLPDTAVAGTLDLFHGAAYPVANVSGSYRFGTQAGRFEGTYTNLDSVSLQLSPLTLPGLGRTSITSTLTLDEGRGSATGIADFIFETLEGTRSIRGSAEMSRY